jgi:hypothetical protein
MALEMTEPRHERRQSRPRDPNAPWWAQAPARPQTDLLIP